MHRKEAKEGVSQGSRVIRRVPVEGAKEVFQSLLYVVRKMGEGREHVIGLVEAIGTMKDRQADLARIIERYGIVPEPPEPEKQFGVHPVLEKFLDKLKYGYRTVGWQKDEIADAVVSAANFPPGSTVDLHQWKPNPLKHHRGINGVTYIGPSDGTIRGYVRYDAASFDFAMKLDGSSVSLKIGDDAAPVVIQREKVPSELQRIAAEWKKGLQELDRQL